MLILPSQTCVTFPKLLNLCNQEAMAPFPTSKMEDHPFRLYQAAHSIHLHVSTIFEYCLLNPQSKDMTCHDRTDFANMDRKL